MSDEVKIGDRFEWKNLHSQIKPGVYTAGPPPKAAWVGNDPWFTIVDGDGKTIGQTMRFGDETAWRRLPREQPTVPREAKSWADLRAGMRVRFRAHGHDPEDSQVVVHANKHGGIWRLDDGVEYAPRGDLFSAGVVTILADPGQSAPQPAPAIDPWAQRHDFTDPYAVVVGQHVAGVKLALRVCAVCGVSPGSQSECKPNDWRAVNEGVIAAAVKSLDQAAAKAAEKATKDASKLAIETVPYRHSHVGGWSRRAP